MESMASAFLRIAVASDLHAYSQDDSHPSHLKVTDSETLVGDQPISGLLELVTLRGLTANILLSPGDLGHKASIAGVKYAWQALHKIKQALQAEYTTATAGNHDIDSRYQGDDHAPEHILKALIPSYPFDDELSNDRYWSRAYVIRTFEDYRLVLLNSSAYHGHTPVEQNHGRIDKQTLSTLSAELKNLPPKPVNILLCHHHPLMHSELGLGEDDYMKNGQLLLDLLGGGQVGQWLVIHGHKHHPRISYASGGSNSPAVFSAGSLCANL